jgi:hypothetical protein
MAIKIEITFETVEEAAAALAKFAQKDSFAMPRMRPTDAGQVPPINRHPIGHVEHPGGEIVLPESGICILGMESSEDTEATGATEATEDTEAPVVDAKAYIDAARKAQIDYGMSLLQNAQKAAGNLTDSGEAMQIKSEEMLKSPARQFKFLAELQKLQEKAARKAATKTAEPPPAESLAKPEATEELTKESYLAEIARLEASFTKVDNKAWPRACAKAGCIAADTGRPRNPARVDDPKLWPGILAGLREQEALIPA